MRALTEQCDALDAAAKESERLRAQLRERADQTRALHAALDEAQLLRARCEPLGDPLGTPWVPLEYPLGTP